MFKRKSTLIILCIVGFLAIILLSGCSDTSEFDKRKEANKVTNKVTLEKTNLKERIRRQERPTAIGYVYLVNFGKPFGYYVIKGKVSSSGSQLGPEDDIICRYAGDSCQAVDGPQDDGTYGQGDPGIFFFTADGTMVETSMEYIYSDKPMAIEVPLLGGK